MLPPLHRTKPDTHPGFSAGGCIRLCWATPPEFVWLSHHVERHPRSHPERSATVRVKPATANETRFTPSILRATQFWTAPMSGELERATPQKSVEGAMLE